MGASDVQFLSPAVAVEISVISCGRSRGGLTGRPTFDAREFAELPGLLPLDFGRRPLRHVALLPRLGQPLEGGHVARDDFAVGGHLG